jgi:hypothetical protein
MARRDETPERLVRGAGVALVALALLGLALFTGSLGRDPQAPADRRCHELTAAANAIAQREDTVADETEYLRRIETAERACAEAAATD